MKESYEMIWKKNKKFEEYKINIYCIKCLMFTQNKKIKIKHKIDGKINLYSCCFDCSFKKSETIDEEKLNYFFIEV